MICPICMSSRRRVAVRGGGEPMTISPVFAAAR